MPITAKLKAQWLEVLRDPESIQAKHDMYNPGTGGMCCLGHLACILGAAPDPDLPTDTLKAFRLYKDGREAAFGSILEDFIDPGLTPGERQRLSVANDKGDDFPFEEIEALEEISEEFARVNFPIYKELSL